LLQVSVALQKVEHAGPYQKASQVSQYNPVK
jgi:hypothetical protein